MPNITPSTSILDWLDSEWNLTERSTNYLFEWFIKRGFSDRNYHTESHYNSHIFYIMLSIWFPSANADEYIGEEKFNISPSVAANCSHLFLTTPTSYPNYYSRWPNRTIEAFQEVLQRRFLRHIAVRHQSRCLRISNASSRFNILEPKSHQTLRDLNMFMYRELFRMIHVESRSAWE